jgi:hypothetical protein
MAEKPSSGRLVLDPGRPHRKSKSGCRCLLWVGLFIVTLAVGWVFYIIASSFFKFVSAIRFPHKIHYQPQNETLLNITSGSVVRPLVNSEQTFDIAVTVWVRATEEEEEEHRRLTLKDVNLTTEGPKGTEESTLVAPQVRTGSGEAMWMTSSTEELLKDEDLLETPLYSDIAFRGLRLSDKDISTSINFRLPTARLCAISEVIPPVQLYLPVL